MNHTTWVELLTGDKQILTTAATTTRMAWSDPQGLWAGDKAHLASMGASSLHPEGPSSRAAETWFAELTHNTASGGDHRDLC